MVFPLRREGADMKIFHSPDLEPLLAHCAERLSTPLSDPFAAEIIVVPHADMVRYLKRQLSRSLGATSPKHADGIVANVKFVYPRQIANATVTDFFGTDDSAWDSHRLTWAIAETTEAQKREVPGFRTAPLTVSRRIADLFDRYASHRPEMIKFWRSAGSGGILPGDQQGWLRADGSQNWQQLLFDSVAQFLDNDIAASPRAVHDVGGDGLVHPARRGAALRRALRHRRDRRGDRGPVRARRQRSPARRDGRRPREGHGRRRLGVTAHDRPRPWARAILRA